MAQMCDVYTLNELREVVAELLELRGWKISALARQLNDRGVQCSTSKLYRFLSPNPAARIDHLDYPTGATILALHAEALRELKGIEPPAVSTLTRAEVREIAEMAALHIIGQVFGHGLIAAARPAKPGDGDE